MRLGRRTSRWTVVVMTDRRGLCRPILVQFLLLLSSFPSTASMTDRHRHNSLSRVFVLKHFNSWNLGTGITSLNFTMNMQDGPAQPRQTVTSSVGGLFCISSLKISAFIFGQISCKTMRNLFQNQHKNTFRHTKLKEKVFIIP